MYKDGKTDIEVRQGLANIFYSKEEKWGEKQKKMGIFFKNGKNQHLSERERVNSGTAVGIKSSPGPYTSGPGMLMIDSNQLNSQCQMYEGKESNNILSTPNSLSGKLNRNK